MPNNFTENSATAPIIVGSSVLQGFVQPSPGSTPPYSGATLDDFMQFLVVGITGLSPDLVFPRWQDEPPNLPDRGVNWAAVGVTRTTPLGYSAATELNMPAGEGSEQVDDWEEFDVLCSFYSKDSDSYAIKLRQGLNVAQNREILQLNNIGLVTTSGRTRVPSLMQGRYRERYDITLTFTRQIRQTYPIRYLLSDPIQVTTDTGVTVND